MAYYLRAFCTSADLPPLRTVFTWAQGHGVRLDTQSVDVDARDWCQAEVFYKPERQPFIVEANADKLLRDEVEEFVEILDDVDDSPEKTKVLDHLEETKAAVAVQLLDDIDDDAYTAAGTFLTYFVEHHGGLIQADGEGFYEGDQLIVEVE